MVIFLVIKVITDKGEYDADVVIVCVGFKPSTEMFKGKLNMISNGAIIVDEYMRTSREDVFAAGDCAAVWYNPTKSYEYIPLATNAVRMGTLAARNLVDNRIKWRGTQVTSGIKIYDYNIASTGLIEEVAKQNGLNIQSVTIEDNYRPEFMPTYEKAKLKVVYERDTGRILGSQILSKHDLTPLMNTMSVFIQNEMTIDDLAFTDLMDKNNMIEFSGSLKNELLKQLPKIIKSDNVIIKGDLNKKIVVEDLKTLIYIDKYKKGIKLDVIFKYGEKEIKAFTSDENTSLIIRNFEAEGKVLNLLEQSGFKQVNNYLVLEDEGGLYMFLKHIMPALKDLAEIFYTDAVKGIYRERSISVSTKIKNNGSNLIGFEFEISDIDKKEIVNVLKSIKEKKNYHRLKSGEIISLEEKNIEEVKKILNEFEDSEIIENEIDIPKYRALAFLNKFGDHLNIEGRKEIDIFLSKIKNAKEEMIEIPASLKNILRDYQVICFKWLKTLSNLDLGGILADDMGLGKTLQTITLILSENKNKKFLIVAPSSLLFNWKSEFERFAPEVKVLIVEGDRKKREELISEIENNDVIITSYPLIRRDIEFYKNYEFDMCILDEAQHIKNPESLNARSVKKINSRVRFALTGTPMENNLSELWSIFDFVLPGLLYSKNEFLDKYEKPILKYNDKNTLEYLKKTIAPFILRRKKSDVLNELPEKIETKLICEMTKKQNELYKAYLLKAREDVERLIKNGEFESNKIQVLKLLTRLRQICCHPSIFLEDYKGDSGKFNQLEELLEELIEGNHKVLIFSQFTSLLDLTKKILEEKKIKYSYLDGSTDVSKRKVIVDEFNNGKTDIFLLSLKAGGTGLNLTTADTVIHLDPWWNPAVEEQASDRAHRIGQKKVVQVFKMITKDSIEEKIYDLQNKKKELIDSVIKEGEVFISSLSEKEILDILK
ncbi:MAG: helicase associated domain protein [Caloramator sp.]|jgi:SNF2 family DNA or RNA helicase|uniref:SNF2-related protein n=1 Tax=Caloramator sp. TaxID=1871330 RepID=UPI001E02572B|nr:SNF2-related protein [Caloramator sp.]MBZ4663719.1 helicase associated domain protein [Caloramator sp.]